MYFVIRKSIFRSRWHVYEMGHLDGDEKWLASFANQYDARAYVKKVLYSNEELP